MKSRMIIAGVATFSSISSIDRSILRPQIKKEIFL